jgi:hypothetical protein
MMSYLTGIPCVPNLLARPYLMVLERRESHPCSHSPRRSLCA